MTQTVLISGTTSGIGLATAHQLDALGWRVFAGALPGEDTGPLAEGASERLTIIPLDITDDASVAAAVQQVAAASPQGLNGLINNAGIIVTGPLEALPLDRLRQQFEVNVVGHLRMVQACLPLLRQAPQARIVNTSSIMSRMTTPLAGAYGMSKHAMQALTATLRQELAPMGIYVTAVEPGSVRTPLSAGLPQQAERDWQSVPEPLKVLYEKSFRAMHHSWSSRDTVAVTPEMVAAVIIHALTTTRPRPRYTAGSDVRWLPLLLRLLPEGMFERIVLRQLGL